MKLFVDGRTYGQTYGHLRPTLLGRLGGVNLIASLDVQTPSTAYTCHRPHRLTRHWCAYAIDDVRTSNNLDF